MGQNVFQMQQDACVVILKIVLQYLKKSPKNLQPFSPLSAVLSNEILIYDTYCSPCSWGTVKNLLFIYICGLYHMLFIKHYFCFLSHFWVSMYILTTKLKQYGRYTCEFWSENWRNLPSWKCDSVLQLCFQKRLEERGRNRVHQLIWGETEIEFALFTSGES